MRSMVTVLLFVGIGLAGGPSTSIAVQPGEPAPDFTIPTIQGEPDFVLSAHANEVVVLSLFYTE